MLGLTPGIKISILSKSGNSTFVLSIIYTLRSEKNTNFCFLAQLLEKVTNLNENFTQNS